MLSSIPPCYQATLKYFVKHLNTISKNAEKNKMNAYNLSTCMYVFIYNIYILSYPSMADPLKFLIENFDVIFT